MANTISIQDVLEFFKRYGEEVKLAFSPDRDDSNFGSWRLTLKHADGQVEGQIKYDEKLLKADDHGEISVYLKIDRIEVFHRTFSAKFKEGWLSRGYVVPPEMRVVLDFVKETDKPLREKLREENRQADRAETERRQQVKSEAEEKFRKMMR